MVSSEHGDEQRRGHGRPLPDGDSLYTPGAGKFRQAVERRSAVPLVWLHQRPEWLPPVVLGVLFVAGLMAPGRLGAPFLALVAALFVWLAFLTWPALTGQQRAPRVIMVAVVLVLAVAKALGY